MDTDGRIATNTVQQPMTISGTLLLTQWLSPSYPLGSFAYSHGLETAIAQGWVTDAASLQDWLEDVLGVGSGRRPHRARLFYLRRTAPRKLASRRRICAHNPCSVG